MTNGHPGPARVTGVTGVPPGPAGQHQDGPVGASERVKDPERNRVTPMGEIVAIPLRGAWTGNRGILHSGRQIVRFHASDLWITCALQFRGRYHPDQWLPHHYTFLYFHDEAVSFAAGHARGTPARHSDPDVPAGAARHRPWWEH